MILGALVDFPPGKYSSKKEQVDGDHGWREPRKGPPWLSRKSGLHSGPGLEPFNFNCHQGLSNAEHTGETLQFAFAIFLWERHKC